MNRLETDSDGPRATSRLFDSLTLRLLVPLVATAMLLLGIYAFASFRSTRTQWTELVESGASRTSELIKGATHYGMLLNRKEEVHHTIRQIAESPGVAGIRVYDKRGKIIFSAQPEEIGHQVDERAEACVSCHEAGQPLQHLPHGQRMRMFDSPRGDRILGYINPIENQPSCYEASCHAHSPQQTILGVLDVQMSMAHVDEAIGEARQQLFWATLVAALLLAGGMVVLVDRLVRRPVRRLQVGTQLIAGGDLDTRIETNRRDELGLLADSFNQMTDDLRRARVEITEWSQTLERKVLEKTEALSRVQRQALHMEKMASLGKLAATVAHELNNPLSGILTYAKLVPRTLADQPLSEEVRAETERYASVIQKESSRCGDIVRNLLLFSRQSETERAPTHINEVVRRSLMIVQHHLDMRGVELEQLLADGDDEVLGNSGQLQQALVALLVNAVEALADASEPKLQIEVRSEPEQVVVAVRDNGAGIPAEVLPNIFEPFYSTKNSEHGVGLGLAVVYGIVKNHGGSIEVDSELGHGTAFRFTVLRRPPNVPVDHLEGAGAHLD